MTPDLVVDVGNTCIKWGRCIGGSVTDTCRLAPGDVPGWERQLESWQLPRNLRWAVASVHPQRCRQLCDWLGRGGSTVFELFSASQLPLTVRLEHPDRAGIDRLLDGVAANTRRRPGAPAVLIDAGSAVTVDWLDETGAFCGGAILPGLRLMARALHDHTALLPEIEPPRQAPPLPGNATIPAMAAGIYRAVAGGIGALCEQYATGTKTRPDIFLTGGDGPALHPVLGADTQLWPTMTLEGIRLAAEALP